MQFDPEGLVMTRKPALLGALLGALSSAALVAPAADAAMTFDRSSVATQDVNVATQVYRASTPGGVLTATCASSITLDVPRVGPFNPGDQIGIVLLMTFRCGAGETVRLLNSPRILLGSATATTLTMQVVDAQISATTALGTCLFRGAFTLVATQGAARGALGGGTFSSVSGPCDRGATAPPADAVFANPLSWTGTAI